MKGKIVFVTGASSGIGAATAMEFARLGAKLVLCARRWKAAGDGGGAAGCGRGRPAAAGDGCARSRGGELALGELKHGWQAVDVLVNNAGLSRGLTKLYEDDIENWEEMIDTNVKGLLYVTRAIVPGMVERTAGM
jgi:3-hydroxy acid dehydrogenase/malonic semialdehyde reductase